CPACGDRAAESAGFRCWRRNSPAPSAVLIRFRSPHSLRYFWFVARSELIVALADRFFPSAKCSLEIDCVNGAVLRATAASRRWERLAGSDLHPAGLKHARTRLPPEVELVQMDARAIPVLNAFDLTGAFDVVEPDDEAVQRGLRRATVMGGGTIIAVPQHPSLWSRADEIGHHQRRYRLRELEAKLRRSGFDILFSSSHSAAADGVEPTQSARPPPTTPMWNVKLPSARGSTAFS